MKFSNHLKQNGNSNIVVDFILYCKTKKKNKKINEKQNLSTFMT